MYQSPPIYIHTYSIPLCVFISPDSIYYFVTVFVKRPDEQRNEPNNHKAELTKQRCILRLVFGESYCIKPVFRVFSVSFAA